MIGWLNHITVSEISGNWHEAGMSFQSSDADPDIQGPVLGMIRSPEANPMLLNSGFRVVSLIPCLGICCEGVMQPQMLRMCPPGATFKLTHWFRQWLVAWWAPSHYLNQCWNMVNWTLRNKHRWNFNQNSYILIQENAFENVIWKMAAILSWPQCVKDAV